MSVDDLFIASNDPPPSISALSSFDDHDNDGVPSSLNNSSSLWWWSEETVGAAQSNNNNEPAIGNNHTLPPLQTMSLPSSMTSSNVLSSVPEISHSSAILSMPTSTTDSSTANVPLNTVYHVIGNNNGTSSMKLPACQICFSHKVKCDGMRPCQRCKRMNRAEHCIERVAGQKVSTRRHKMAILTPTPTSMTSALFLDGTQDTTIAPSMAATGTRQRQRSRRKRDTIIAHDATNIATETPPTIASSTIGMTANTMTIPTHQQGNMGVTIADAVAAAPSLTAIPAIPIMIAEPTPTNNVFSSINSGAGAHYQHPSSSSYFHPAIAATTTLTRPDYRLLAPSSSLSSFTPVQHVSSHSSITPQPIISKLKEHEGDDVVDAAPASSSTSLSPSTSSSSSAQSPESMIRSSSRSPVRKRDRRTEPFPFSSYSSSITTITRFGHINYISNPNRSILTFGNTIMSFCQICR
jgi:hypothetical protein